MRTWTRSGADAEELRFSEVLSALSFALDLVEGQPEGHTVRSCLMEVLGLRSGRWFDPALVEALLAEARECGLRKSPGHEPRAPHLALRSY